jgi:hypothetical protein
LSFIGGQKVSYASHVRIPDPLLNFFTPPISKRREWNHIPYISQIHVTPYSAVLKTPRIGGIPAKIGQPERFSEVAMSPLSGKIDAPRGLDLQREPHYIISGQQSAIRPFAHAC